MSVISPARSAGGAGGVGGLVRDWRHRRRLSQLDLAIEAEVSARHLSFVETGRSKPSRELLLHLAEHLEVPLRERNSWLLAAGYAPVYPESAMDDGRMEPIRDALHKILAAHEPFPAVIVDRQWNLVSANEAAGRILTHGVPPALLEPPANALRISLHPSGLAPRIENFADYSAHLMARLHRQARASGDVALLALYEELREYPDVVAEPAPAHDVADLLFVPLVLRDEDRRPLTFFSTIATFGTALDITVAELAIESFFPADRVTEAALRAAAG